MFPTYTCNTCSRNITYATGVWRHDGAPLADADHTAVSRNVVLYTDVPG